MDYSTYKDLKIRRVEPGILEIAMGEEGKLAVATARAHAEMEPSALRMVLLIVRRHVAA